MICHQLQRDKREVRKQQIEFPVSFRHPRRHRLLLPLCLSLSSSTSFYLPFPLRLQVLIGWLGWGSGEERRREGSVQWPVGVALLVMKRRREMESVTTEMRAAIEELSLMVKLNPATVKLNDCSVVEDRDDHHRDKKQDDHHHAPPFIPARPFFSLCTLVVQVLGN